MPKEKVIKEVTVIDPKIIEVSVKVAELGKATFILETKKDVSKLAKKAVLTAIKFAEKKLDELGQEAL